MHKLALMIVLVGLGARGPPASAAQDRLEEIRQTYRQRASVIRSVRYMLRQTVTRLPEGTRQLLRVDPRTRIIDPDKPYTERRDLIRIRDGERDAYDLTVYPKDGQEPIGHVQRVWDGQSGKLLDHMLRAGALETSYESLHEMTPERVALERLGRPLYEWIEKAGPKLQIRDRGDEVEIAFATGPTTETRYVLDPSRGFLPKSYLFLNRGTYFETGTITAVRRDTVEGVAVYTPTAYATTTYVPAPQAGPQKVVPLLRADVRVTQVEFNGKYDDRTFDLTFPPDTQVYDHRQGRHLPVRAANTAPAEAPANQSPTTARATGPVASPPGDGPLTLGASGPLEQAIDRQAAELASSFSADAASGSPQGSGTGQTTASTVLWIAAGLLALVSLVSLRGRRHGFGTAE